MNEAEIFFGPCKRPLREVLRERYLRNPDTDHAKPKKDIYFVGINAKNERPGPDNLKKFGNPRKIIWAGKLKSVMTFAYAFNELEGGIYTKMRKKPNCPLHVEPIIEGGKIRGYERVKSEHAKDNYWVGDLVKVVKKKPVHSTVSDDGKTLKLDDGTDEWKGFTRDACMLFDNIFYARKEKGGPSGIDIDDEILDVLLKAQPNRSEDVTAYCPFGLTRSGSVDGRRGSQLVIHKYLAEKFIELIETRAKDKKKSGVRVASSDGDEQHGGGGCGSS